MIVVAVATVVCTFLATTYKISASDYGIVLQIIGFVLWIIIKSSVWKNSEEANAESTDVGQAAAILAVIGGLILQLPILEL